MSTLKIKTTMAKKTSTSKTKTTKKTTVKEKATAAPPAETKKRGRPTTEEVRAKKKKEYDADIALRKELIERQLWAATVEPSVSASVEIPKYPIFMPGQRVEATYNGITYQGHVVHDNLESAMIRVRWDDGSCQYAAKMNLKVVVKKTTKKLFSAKQLKQMEE